MKAIYKSNHAVTARRFIVVSASPALQTTFEIFLQAFRSCAADVICSKSSFLPKVDIGKSLFVNFALVITLFNLVTRVFRGLPLNHFLILRSRISSLLLLVFHQKDVIRDFAPSIFLSRSWYGLSSNL